VNFGALLTAGAWLAKYWRAITLAVSLTSAVGAAWHWIESRADQRAAEAVTKVRDEQRRTLAAQVQRDFQLTLDQERISADADAQHAARLGALRRYYAGRMREQTPAMRTGPGETASVPERPGESPAGPGEQGACRPGVEYDALEARAAEDALMVLDWQRWYHEQQKLRSAE